jgi:ribonuclease P protein component
MLPKINRLSLKKDFVFLKNKGLRRQSQSFGLLYTPTQNPHTRVGFIVSNKISLKASVRNKAKRWLREAAYRQMPSKSFDLLFLAKKEILTSSFAKVQEEAKEVLLKINS